MGPPTGEAQGPLSPLALGIARCSLGSLRARDCGSGDNGIVLAHEDVGTPFLPPETGPSVPPVLEYAAAGHGIPRATQGQAPTVPGLVASRHWPQPEDWGPPLTDGLATGPRLHAEPPLVPRPLTTLCALTCCVEGVEWTHVLSPRPLRGPGGPRPAERGAEVASQPWGPARVPLGAWDSAACRERGGHRRLPGEALSREPCSPLPLPTRGGGSPVTGAPGDPGGPCGGALVPVWLSARGEPPPSPPPAIPPSHAQAQRHMTV